MMYGPWDISRDRRNFLSVWSIFFPFTPENPENQNFEKMEKKKTPGDFIILHINDNDDVRLLRWVRQITLFIILGHLPQTTTQKSKILKKWQKPLQLLSFYTRVPKIMVTCYTVPETWHVMDVIFIFHFGLLFSLLHP